MHYQLRGDLEQSRQQHQGKSFLVVKDPVTRRYFRFTESQAAILDLLAAPIDIDTLAVQSSEKLGYYVSPATIQAFIDSLESKFLVDTASVREKLGTNARFEKPGRNILYWRLVSINPERIFDWLGPRTQWAFTPAFQLVGIALILSGFAISFLHWDRLWASAPDLFNIWTLLAIWPVMFVVSAYHEFSHGLTCRHFGGKVHEVGFMLIYFSPAFYCDVSDAWMFASRRNRVLVTLAGGYSQLMLWGFCTIVWRLTDPDAWINQIMLIVVLYSGLQTLLNFNPLIKLDGYYMLSDYMEVPNLRAKSFKTLWARVAGKVPVRSWREDRAQILYGIASVVFSTTLLVYVYASLYKWATGTWAFAGLVGFLMFSSVTLRKTAAESVTGLKALASRAALKRWRNITIGLAAIVIAFTVNWELKIPAEARILAHGEASVRPQMDGVIDEVLVRQGSRVSNGDVVARLRDFNKLSERSRLEGLIAEKKAELERLRTGARPEELDTAQKLVDRVRVELANIRGNQEDRARLEEGLARLNTQLQRDQLDYQRKQDLVREGVIARTELDDAENAVKVRQREIREKEAEIRAFDQNRDLQTALKEKELAQAQSAQKLIRAGNNPGLIKEAEAHIATLERQLNVLNDELVRTEMRSPIDGVVTTPFPERLVNQFLESGDDFMRIVDTSRVYVEMLVPEKEIADVQPGHPVRIKVRGLSAEDFAGRVDFIPPAAQTVNGQQMFAVRAELPNDTGILKADMTGVAKIYVGERRIIQVITRRVHRWVRTEFWDLLP